MAKVKVLKVLKVLNIQGTSQMGFFAARTGYRLRDAICKPGDFTD
ncbi:MAG: hypothetical protein K0S14_2051 [Thermomicrobiales bacterium]|jgi:hypothetical protein|nr:hypothetical protein [Thermomicrobiales bacterium]